MNLIKTSFYTSISQGISIIAGLISIKVVSVKIGPKGMAMMGQYLNSTAILSLLATGAIGTGVVKYLAEYKDKSKQLNIISTGFRITLFSSLIIALASLLLSSFLSKETFKTGQYASVYILWSFFLFFTTLSSLFSNVLNGLKQIPYLTIINISGTLVGLAVTIVFAYQFGVYGVLIASNFTALSLFLLHLYFFNKYRWFSLSELIRSSDKKLVKMLFGFMLMSLVSGLLAPSIQLLVRDRIIEKFSFEEAGYWQSVTRISDYYLNFFITVISVYYLPRLSEINNNHELRAEIMKMFKIVLPAIALTSFLIWISRFLIIRLLLTPDFLPSAELFGVQFIGDFFKIASWLLAYVMLAKALKYQYIFSEIVFSITYVLLCFFFIEKYGIVGAVYGFLVNYVIFFFVMSVFIKRYIK